MCEKHLLFVKNTYLFCAKKKNNMNFWHNNQEIEIMKNILGTTENIELFDKEGRRVYRFYKNLYGDIGGHEMTQEYVELCGAIFRQAIYDDATETKVKIREELFNLGYNMADITDAISNEHEVISSKVQAFVLQESPKWPRNTVSDAVRNRQKIYKESLANCKKYITEVAK
jgi:hypothetical protein